jgi:hypothetical protein
LEVIACRLPKDYFQAFESVIIKNTEIFENDRKKAKLISLSFSIIFTVIVLPLSFSFRPKNQKKLENDFRKSEIIIFVFIPNYFVNSPLSIFILKIKKLTLAL